MPASKADFLAALYQALAEPRGLVLSTNDPARARMKLYAARKASGDSELDCLQVRLSPFPEGDLVITKGAGKS